MIANPTHAYTQKLLNSIPKLSNIVAHDVLLNHRNNRPDSIPDITDTIQHACVDTTNTDTIVSLQDVSIHFRMGERLVFCQYGFLCGGFCIFGHSTGQFLWLGGGKWVRKKPHLAEPY